MTKKARAGSASRERRVLLVVFVLNLGLAVALAVTGIWADSSGLIANAVDNGCDAAVYLVSVLAVGRAPRWKWLAAIISGVLLLIFALGVLGDTVRRAGSEPVGGLMMAMAMAAGAAARLLLRVGAPSFCAC